MSAVSLAQIIAVAPAVGWPRDKKRLIAKLDKAGAQHRRGTVRRGQTGNLYAVETLPPDLRDALTSTATVEEAPQATAAFDRYLLAPPSQRSDADRRLSMVQRVRELLDAGTPKTKAYAEVATEAEVSASTVKSAWRKVEKLHPADWLAALVKNYKGRAPKARGVIAVIAGPTGVGKSKTLRQMERAHPAVWYCQFQREDCKTVPAMLRAIGKAVDLYYVGSGSARLSSAIVERVVRRRGLLILDEAQHLSRDCFEQVRSIYDATEHDGLSIGLVFAGHLDLLDKVVSASPQLEGRLGARLRIPSASEADVDALCAYWELECPRSREFLRSQAGQRTGLRRVAKIYELALSYAAAQDAPVTFDHVRQAWKAFGGSVAGV